MEDLILAVVFTLFAMALLQSKTFWILVAFETPILIFLWLGSLYPHTMNWVALCALIAFIVWASSHPTSRARQLVERIRRRRNAEAADERSGG